MSDNIVYEISKLMSDESIIKSDLNDAAGLVTEMFKKKYVNKLNEKVTEHKKVLTKNPPKEVQLINALKQFMPEESRKTADKAIDAYITASTFAKLQKEFSVSREATAMLAGSMPTARPKPNISKPNDITENRTAADVHVAESSVHEDGIYELDENCIKNKSGRDMAGMLMAMAVLMR